MRRAATPQEKDQSVQNSKCQKYKVAKSLRFRLAETERELEARTPIARRLHPKVVQPQTVAAASEPEDVREAVRVATGVGDLLHTNTKPFS